MLTLEKPDVKYKNSYIEFIRECQKHATEPLCATNSWWNCEGKTDISDLEEHFEGFVIDRLDTKNGSLAKWWENEFIQYWIIKDKEFIGYLDIRPTLQSDFAKNNGGHVGVMIRPSVRGKAYPMKVMIQAIQILKDLGLSRILLTCNSKNHPSRRLIEHLMHTFGGTYDGIHKMTYKGKNWESCRYWIDVQ